MYVGTYTNFYTIFYMYTGTYMYFYIYIGVLLLLLLLLMVVETYCEDDDYYLYGIYTIF